MAVLPCGACDCADPTAMVGLADECDCYCHAPKTTAHVRKPIRRSFNTSSSGYVRRSLQQPTPETLCGAPVTDRDASIRDVKLWIKSGENVCGACVAQMGA